MAAAEIWPEHEMIFVADRTAIRPGFIDSCALPAMDQPAFWIVIMAISYHPEQTEKP
ncbi:hypothetical protein [Agrobacterium sp. rho-13.3]|uniref:hypothetical protein n=1 Tax=Agrobacterium sp. rho-13.3 TaxID=3072980 RepID=UPI002A24A7A6|nr:hypothetical protein [Agrobacterium sp. rho-13.3]